MYSITTSDKLQNPFFRVSPFREKQRLLISNEYNLYQTHPSKFQQSQTYLNSCSKANYQYLEDKNPFTKKLNILNTVSNTLQNNLNKEEYKLPTNYSVCPIGYLKDSQNYRQTGNILINKDKIYDQNSQTKKRVNQKIQNPFNKKYLIVQPVNEELPYKNTYDQIYHNSFKYDKSVNEVTENRRNIYEMYGNINQYQKQQIVKQRKPTFGKINNQSNLRLNSKTFSQNDQIHSQLQLQFQNKSQNSELKEEVSFTRHNNRRVKFENDQGQKPNKETGKIKQLSLKKQINIQKSNQHPQILQLRGLVYYKINTYNI